MRLGKILITKRGINFIKVSRGFNYATLKFPPHPKIFEQLERRNFEDGKGGDVNETLCERARE